MSKNIRKNTKGFFKTHGMAGTQLYNTWNNIIKRCHNEKNPRYKNYGGKGIYVCSEWRESIFEFVEWANNNGFVKGLTIDRINNDGPYSPENCRWITNKENNRNRSNHHLVTYNNETHPISVWVEKTGLSHKQIEKRLRCGWTVEEALTLKSYPGGRGYHR